MEKERITFNSLGRDLVGIVEYPKKNLGSGVVLFHGLTNSKDDCPLIKEVAEALVENGLVAFRFDFFGSGESPGLLADKTWGTFEKNARDAINCLKTDQKITKIGLWGRSTGGAIAILCSDVLKTEAFVLATTPVLLQNVFVTRFEEVKKLELGLEQKGRKLPGTGRYKGEFRLSEGFFKEVPVIEERIMKKLSTMNSVLVLATTPDTKVPLENATTIINKVKEPKQIHIFEGVDHDYKGVEERAVDLTVSWFKKYLT